MTLPLFILHSSNAIFDSLFHHVLSKINNRITYMILSVKSAISIMKLTRIDDRIN